MKEKPETLTGVSAARGSLLLTSMAFTRIIGGLGVLVILTRVLGVKDYGVYLLLLSVGTFVGSVFQLGAGRVVGADISRDIGDRRYDQVRGLLGDYTKVQLAIGTVVTGCLLVAVPFATQSFGKAIGEGLPLVAGLVALTGVRNVVNVLLSSHGSFGAIAMWQNTEVVLRLAAVVVFVWMVRLGVWGALLADVLSQIGGILLMSLPVVRTLGYLRHYQRPPGWVLPTILKAHGKWHVFHTAATSATSNWRLWLVAFFLGADGAGIYGLARRTVASFPKGIFPLKTVLDPLFAREARDYERIRFLFQMATKYKLLVAAAVVVAGNIVVGPVVAWLFPNFYPVAVPVLRVYLFIHLTKILSQVLSPYLNAMQAQRYSFYTFVIGLVSFAVLAPPLVISLGVVGAALEAVISTFITGLASFVFARKVDPSLRLDVPALFRYGRDDWALFKRVVFQWRHKVKPVETSARVVMK